MVCTGSGVPCWDASLIPIASDGRGAGVAGGGAGRSSLNEFSPGGGNACPDLSSAVPLGPNGALSPWWSEACDIGADVLVPEAPRPSG